MDQGRAPWSPTRSEAEQRRVAARLLFDFEVECRAQGWGDPAFVYDEEKDLFRFRDGRFAFSRVHANWSPQEERTAQRVGVAHSAVSGVMASRSAAVTRVSRRDHARSSVFTQARCTLPQALRGALALPLPPLSVGGYDIMTPMATATV